MDVQRTLEHDLELLCLTGVEDKLQVILCAKTVSSVVNNDTLRSRGSKALGKVLHSSKEIFKIVNGKHSLAPD